MKVIAPSFVIEDDFDGDELLKKIERAGRTCYKSEHKVTADSARKFIKKIMAMGHESVIEHEKVTVRVVCDRGVTHEIVRHRLASYSQESTRYCNYTKDKFGSEITVIDPFFWKPDGSEGGNAPGEPGLNDAEKYAVWKESMEASEKSYFKLIDLNASPQEARSVLPNSLKTEIVMTMNLREWRHFFRLRTAPGSHPQMREIAIPMLEEFRRRIPVLFDDITVHDAPGGATIGT